MSFVVDYNWTYNVSAYPWDELNTTGRDLTLVPLYGERVEADAFENVTEISALIVHVVLFVVIWLLSMRLLVFRRGFFANELLVTAARPAYLS